MSSRFILIVNDGYTMEQVRVPAYAIADERLQKRVWPIYSGTRHREVIAAGDKVLIYAAGTKQFCQSFLAKADIKQTEVVGRLIPQIDPKGMISPDPFRLLHLDQVSRFDPPVLIRPLLEKLKFVPKSKKWGAALMGGCRVISAADFQMVIQHTK